MPCSNCGRAKVLARGLCRRCYQRGRLDGSLERRNVHNSGTCSVEGCDKPSFAKNLCPHHYEKAQHPLNHSWRLIRSRHPGQFPPSWAKFEAFLADVGERPSPSHQLRRINATQPYGASNVRWVEPVRPGQDHMSPEQRSVYQREWHLQRKFKITGEQYAALLKAQGGVCASCGGVETHRSKNGKLKDLAVDHDHETNEIRGLLCFNCNQAIGRFQDDPVLMRAAAAYIEARRPKLRLVSGGDGS
jgi:hypothetical protein